MGTCILQPWSWIRKQKYNLRSKCDKVRDLSVVCRYFPSAVADADPKAQKLQDYD